MNEHTPTPVDGIPVPMPLPETQGQRNLLLMSVPVLAVASMLGLAVVAGVNWQRVSSHLDNGQVHLDESKMVEEGGVVTARRLRQTLRAMEINCSSSPAGGMLCHVQIPKEAE